MVVSLVGLSESRITRIQGLHGLDSVISDQSFVLSIDFFEHEHEHDYELEWELSPERLRRRCRDGIPRYSLTRGPFRVGRVGNAVWLTRSRVKLSRCRMDFVHIVSSSPARATNRTGVCCFAIISLYLFIVQRFQRYFTKYCEILYYLADIRSPIW